MARPATNTDHGVMKQLYTTSLPLTWDVGWQNDQFCGSANKKNILNIKISSNLSLTLIKAQEIFYNNLNNKIFSLYVINVQPSSMGLTSHLKYVQVGCELNKGQRQREDWALNCAQLVPTSVVYLQAVGYINLAIVGCCL